MHRTQAPTRSNLLEEGTDEAGEVEQVEGEGEAQQLEAHPRVELQQSTERQALDRRGGEAGGGEEGGQAMGKELPRERGRDRGDL